MPGIKITPSVLDRLPQAPGSQPVYYFDDLLKGFAVRVSPRGVKAYLVQGYVKGKLHRKALGRYPTIAPEAARKRARAALEAMAEGQSPERRTEQVIVAAALDKWLQVHVAHKLKPRTAFDYRQIVTKALKPALGSMMLKDVARADLAKLHHDRRKTPRRANYILAVARSFFSYCEDAGYRPQDTNPAKRIRGFPENHRERFLSEVELGRAARSTSKTDRRSKAFSVKPLPRVTPKTSLRFVASALGSPGAKRCDALWSIKYGQRQFCLELANIGVDTDSTHAVSGVS